MASCHWRKMYFAIAITSSAATKQKMGAITLSNAQKSHFVFFVVKFA